MFHKICECIALVLVGGGYCLTIFVVIYYLFKGIIMLIKDKITNLVS